MSYGDTKDNENPPSPPFPKGGEGGFSGKGGWGDFQVKLLVNQRVLQYMVVETKSKIKWRCPMKKAFFVITMVVVSLLFQIPAAYCQTAAFGV